MKLGQMMRALWPFGAKAKRDPFAATYGSGGAGGFAGAQVSRLTSSLANWSGSVNADNDIALPILRARARALAANNEHGKRFLSLVATNVVGRRNPKLQVRAMKDLRDPNKPTVLDKSANDTIEIHWERWGKTADISGRHKSLYQMMRTIIKGVARDGEALVRIVRNRRLPYGMALQLLEADRLDDTLNQVLDNGNTIRQGVELDSTSRAIAYWIKTAHPGENYATARAGVERVPAAEMCHVFLTERAEQVRGITWFHAIILRGSIIHKFEESAVIAAHIGASKIATLERSEDAPDATATMADGQTSAGLSMNVEAGEMFELPPGYKLNSWNPDYPHQNFESFLKACLRGLAAGFDVAAHNLTGDMTEVNYSSARIAELAERETWMALQDWFNESFVMPIYEEWLAGALLSGAITFDISGKALPADKLQKFAQASRFQGRRWSWVDPLKEADANEKQLTNKLTSRTRLAAEQGEEFDDILDELAQEQAMIDASGLPAAPKAAPAAGSPPPSFDDASKAMAAQMRALQAELDAARAAPPMQHHYHLPPPPAVTVTSPEIRNDIVVQPAAAPVVEIRNEIITPPAAAPTIEVHVEAIMPEQAAPVVEVNVQTPDEIHIKSMPARVTTSDVERNLAGEITRAQQVEKDL
jgi:lambda family phage portal protein